MPEMPTASIKFNFGRIGAIVFINAGLYHNSAVGGLVNKMKAIPVWWT